MKNIDRFLLSRGFARTRCDEIAQFNDRVVEYVKAYILIRILRDRGVWMAQIEPRVGDKKHFEPSVWKEYLEGSSPILGISEQVAFIIGSIDKIEFALTPENTARTQEELACIKLKRVQRRFPGYPGGSAK